MTEYQSAGYCDGLGLGLSAEQLFGWFGTADPFVRVLEFFASLDAVLMEIND